MHLKSAKTAIITLALLLPISFSHSAQAETQACTNGTALLQNDVHAWYALQNQLARLKKNVTQIRTDINDIIEMNDDIGEADKTARNIHSKLSLIAVLFELMPSLQEGLDKTARAAEVAHKDVLGPTHKVTDAIVMQTKLHEIRAEIDKQILPNIEKMEAKVSSAHLKAVGFSHDFMKACHIASTLHSAACIDTGNKVMSAAYNDFNMPLRLLNTTVLDAAKAVGEVNHYLEEVLGVSLKPVLAIHGPAVDFSKVVRELDHEIHKLERWMKKHIHIHIAPFHLKFTIEHLLKELKAEIKKLEHLVDIDKFKKEVRKEVEKVLKPIVHDIEHFIHKLEHDLTPKGLNLSKLEAELKAFLEKFAFKGPSFDFSGIEKAIKEMEDAIRRLEQCN